MGILSELEPKPDLAVLSVAGQPCYNGGGFTGTATDFILESLQRLGHPKEVRLGNLFPSRVQADDNHLVIGHLGPS